jgi:hypothetical protein
VAYRHRTGAQREKFAFRQEFNVFNVQLQQRLFQNATEGAERKHPCPARNKYELIFGNVWPYCGTVFSFWCVVPARLRPSSSGSRSALQLARSMPSHLIRSSIAGSPETCPLFGFGWPWTVLRAPLSKLYHRRAPGTSGKFHRGTVRFTVNSRTVTLSAVDTDRLILYVPRTVTRYKLVM